jgi:hypothetical protein
VLLLAGSGTVAGQPYYTPPGPGSMVRLDEGTPLIVAPLEDVTSGDNEVGETISFSVVNACRVNGVLLIAQGAPVQGRVEKSKHSKMLGRAGTLAISFHTAQAVDGSILSLRATLSNHGNRNEDDIVHAVKYLPIPFHGTMLFNGQDAILKAGGALTVFINRDADFLITAGPRGARPVRVPTIPTYHPPAPPVLPAKPPRGYTFPQD